MSGKKIASGMNVKDKYTFESVVADLFHGNLTRSYWGRASARARCKIRDYFTRPGRIDERGTLVMDHEANIMRAWSKEGGSYVRIQRGRERTKREIDAARCNTGWTSLEMQVSHRQFGNFDIRYGKCTRGRWLASIDRARCRMRVVYKTHISRIYSGMICVCNLRRWPYQDDRISMTFSAVISRITVQ